MSNFFTRTLKGLILAGLSSLPNTSALYAQQNSESPELFMQTGHSGVVRSLDISSDGKLAATGADDATIRIWSLPTGVELRRMAQGSGVRSVALSPDGHSVAALSYQNVTIWDVDSGVRKKSWSYFDSNPYLQGGLAYTPDGNKIIVADRIRIFVWNIISGQIDHVETFRQGITCFANQPGTNLVAICQGNTALLWDAQKYKIAGTIGPARSTFQVAAEVAAAYHDGVKTLNAQLPEGQTLPEKLDPAIIRGIALATDGKSVVTNHNDGSLRVWNASTGAQMVVAKGEIEDNLTVKPDSPGFATVFGDKIALRSLTTAAIEQELIPPKSSYTNPNPFAWNNGRFSPIRFSPDGHLLVQASVRQGRLIVWDLKSKTAIYTGQTSITVPVALTSGDHGHLYTITGQIAKSWNLNGSPEFPQIPQGITSGVSISRDGNWLAWNDVTTFDVFSAAAGIHKHYVLPNCHDDKSLIECKHMGEGMAEIMGFSTDDSLLFVRETASFMGALSTGTATSFYAVNVGDKSLKTLFTLPPGGTVTDAFSPERNLVAFVQLPSVSQLISGVQPSTHRTIRLFDVTQSKEIGGLIFTAATDEVIEEMVARTHEDNPEKFDDLAKARMGSEQGLRNGEAVTKIAFSSGGEFLAATFQFHGVALWRMNDRKLILLTGPHMRTDGKPGSMPTAISFSADNHWLIAGWDDGTIKKFDTNTATEVASWSGHGNSVTSLAFVAGSDLLISTGEDGTVKFWNLGNAHLLMTLSPGVNPYDWAAVSSAGLFDGGPDGWSRFLWRFHNSIFDTQPIEPYFREYFHPDLLRDFFNCTYAQDRDCGRIQPARTLARINRTLPIIESISVQDGLGSPAMVSVTINIQMPQPQNHAAKNSFKNRVYDVRLFRDGQLVAQCPAPNQKTTEHETYIVSHHDLKVWRREHAIKLDANGRAVIRFTNIRLPQRAGVDAVKFTAYAFNSDRVKSLAARPLEFRFHTATANLRPRTAFLITMGVNANESPHLNFDLAVSSAEETRALLRAKLQDDYQEVVEIPLYSELEPDSNQVRLKSAKKVDLKSVLDLLAGRSIDPVFRNEIDPKHELHSAGPDDAIILYIASHGYVDPAGNFYLMPYDTGSNWGVTEDLLTRCQLQPDQSTSCGRARDLLLHSISSSDLAAWWNGVDAGTMVMVLDSCHSGAVTGKQFRPAPLGDADFGQLAYDKGMLIFSASQPAQTEKGQWVTAGKGLTLLVEALETVAKGDPGKSLIEWLHQTEQQLPLLMTQLYPTIKEVDIQMPLLLDFSNGTKQAALAAGDPLGDL